MITGAFLPATLATAGGCRPATTSRFRVLRRSQGAQPPGGPLLVAAQESREVRDDLTLEQVLDMVIAVSAIRGDSGYVEPIFASHARRHPSTNHVTPHHDTSGRATAVLVLGGDQVG